MTFESSKATEADWPFPAVAPRASGHVPVGKGVVHKLYWEEYGRPDGEPVMFLHGGPGGTCMPVYARFFDPSRYRIILFDQRGCGKSVPNAAQDGVAAALADNTTDHLVEDILTLREALGISGKMHVFGGSWGSTLALVYAIRHPETVQSLILRGIFLGRAEDLAYMYQGNAATYADAPFALTNPGTYIFYPEPWKKFVEVIPPEKRGSMMAAYKDLFDHVPQNEQEKERQKRAVIAWSSWEGAISFSSSDLNDVGYFSDADYAISFAQIEAHYFKNNLFLPDNYILDHMASLASVPVHIVHGRFDQVCPLSQAESLVAALKRVGSEPVSYLKTPVGHSMTERVNMRALVEIMRTMPRS